MQTDSQPRQKSGQSSRRHRRRREREREEERGPVTKERLGDSVGDRPDSDTPKEPPLKRARTNGKGKGKDTELELGELPSGSSRAFDLGDDFLPFVVSDEEEKISKTQESHRREKVPEREWDKGKPREGDEDRGGRGTKRKYEMVFDEDSWDHRQRRQDYHPTSRKTPWVDDVDWDSCHNVAEMCVL
jgi:non-canonical poly(A) RNA polymerase PAPD5/7